MHIYIYIPIPRITYEVIMLYNIYIHITYYIHIYITLRVSDTLTIVYWGNEYVYQFCLDIKCNVTSKTNDLTIYLGRPLLL